MMVDFGGGVVTGRGGTDLFIAKYSPTGTYLSAQTFGDVSNDVGNAVGVAGNGDIVVAGAFISTIDFGTGLLTSAGSSDICLSRAP